MFGKAGFRAWLEQDVGSTATFPIEAALTQSGLDRESADLLGAFDLAQIRNDACRFGDVRVFATMAELIAAGCLPSRAIRILLEARTLAPLGRHKVVLDRHGAPALQWEDGITTLDGQRFLPLPVENDPTEDLFESAMAAEADDQLDEAARLYEAAAQADRSDGISLYNSGTIRLRQGRLDDAVACYRASLKRDPQLIEGHYNLAQVFEAKGDVVAAVKCLEAALVVDGCYSDALFNLAQLRLKADDLRGAADLFERYLKCDDVPAEWQAKAQRALAFCRAKSRMA